MRNLQRTAFDNYGDTVVRAALLVGTVLIGMSACAVVIFAPVSEGPNSNPPSAAWRYGVCALGVIYSLVLAGQMVGQAPSTTRRPTLAAAHLLVATVGAVSMVAYLAQSIDIAMASTAVLALALPLVAGLHVFTAMRYAPARPPGQSVSASLSDRLAAIGRSWLSLKRWVKGWLFLLNGVFLVSIALVHIDRAFGLAVLAYLATAPYLGVMMLVQGGLSRALGLAHIIPWTPLAVYLTTRMVTDTYLGPQLTPVGEPAVVGYVLVLLSCVAVCLAFDYYDVFRWLQGERYLMGDEQAYRSGASKRANGSKEVGAGVGAHPMTQAGN